MAGTRAKVFHVVDIHDTKLTVTERRVSDWQRDLRLKVDGLAYGGGFRDGARHSNSFAIKSPEELDHLAVELQSFLDGTSGSRMYIGPHHRHVGKLTKGSDGAVWELDCRYRTPDLVLVEEDALRSLIDFATHYS